MSVNGRDAMYGLHLYVDLRKHLCSMVKKMMVLVVSIIGRILETEDMCAVGLLQCNRCGF